MRDGTSLRNRRWPLCPVQRDAGRRRHSSPWNRGKQSASDLWIGVAGSLSRHRRDCSAGVLEKGVLDASPRSNARRVPRFHNGSASGGQQPAGPGLPWHDGIERAKSCRQKHGSSYRDRRRLRASPWPATCTGPTSSAPGPPRRLSRFRRRGLRKDREPRQLQLLQPELGKHP